jgi:hypothetical protein
MQMSRNGRCGAGERLMKHRPVRLTLLIVMCGVVVCYSDRISLGLNGREGGRKRSYAMIWRAEIATGSHAIDAAQSASPGRGSGSLAVSAIGVNGIRIRLQSRCTALVPAPL